MRRLRFFRIALPAALLIFLALLGLSLRERPAPHRAGPAEADALGRSATGVRAKRLVGQEQTLDFEARVVEPQADGGFHLEMIERLGIAREGKPPLVVQARGADIAGPAAGRRIVAQDEVVVTDSEEGLVLRLPRLEVDEAAGEARSEGEILFEGAGSRGRATGLIYGLAGQSSELEQPEFEHAGGASVRAGRMVFLDGLHDVELRESVEAHRGEEEFRAGRVRVRRDEEDRLRWALAEGAVTAHVATPVAATDLAADRLEAEWDEQRTLERFSLRGAASVARAEQSISAARIEGTRRLADGAWELSAEGTVLAQGAFAGGAAWIRSESLGARLDPALGLLSARAAGHVRFEAPDMRAEGDRAEFEPGRDAREIRLFGAENGKARMARARTRIAAERITTDERGSQLEARGRVEATLLPGGAGAPHDPGVDGLFRSEQAIHFVADELDAAGSGERLVFRDGVRGWQGERNLSADLVEMDGETRTLAARGRVTTRLPREAERGAPTETDFVQVAADRLDYDGRARLARYSDHVRLTLLEGWLEAAVLEIRLREAGGIEEITAQGDVRIEFSDTEAEGPPQLVSGTGDRVSYVPSEQTVRLFGDARPATVRRLGERGGATSGRVLRYRLDAGTLEVESGEQAPARIRGR